MTPPTLVLHRPCDLLSVIPHQLGFMPSRSVVAVSLRGERRRVGLMVRVDLAALASPGGAADSVLRALRADGAHGVALVVYHEADVAALLLPGELAGPLTVLERDCRASGIEPVAFLLTPSDYWRLDLPACDGALRWLGPRAEVDGADAGRLMSAGVVPADSRADVLRLPAAQPTARRQAMRSAATSWREREELGAPWQLRALAAWREALTADAETAGALRPTSLGRVEAGLRDVAVRDAAMLTLLPDSGASDLAERTLLGLEAAAASAGYRSVLLGDARPAGDVAERARDLLGMLAAHASQRRRVAPLSLWAWLEWWDGRGARAAMLIDEALAADPGYSFAVLMSQLLSGGVGPGWTRVAA